MYYDLYTLGKIIFRRFEIFEDTSNITLFFLYLLYIIFIFIMTYDVFLSVLPLYGLHLPETKLNKDASYTFFLCPIS